MLAMNSLNELFTKALRWPLVMIACTHGHHRSVVLSHLLFEVVQRLRPNRRFYIYHLDLNDGDLIDGFGGLERLIEGPVIDILALPWGRE